MYVVHQKTAYFGSSCEKVMTHDFGFIIRFLPLYPVVFISVEARVIEFQTSQIDKIKKYLIKIR